MKQSFWLPLLRFIWGILLVAQIILYFVCYPSLATIVAKHDLPAGVLSNVLVTDSLGVLFWTMALVFTERLFAERHKVLRMLFIVLVAMGTFVALGMAYINIQAL